MKVCILVLITFLFSCENDNNNIKEFAKGFKLIDSSNYKHKILKNGFLKTVRFFPGTKDTSAIYFLTRVN